MCLLEGVSTTGHKGAHEVSTSVFSLRPLFGLLNTSLFMVRLYCVMEHLKEDRCAPFVSSCCRKKKKSFNKPNFYTIAGLHSLIRSHWESSLLGL